MKKIEEMVSKLFDEGKSENDVEKILLDMKDTFRPDKPRWHRRYIVRKIKDYQREKERSSTDRKTQMEGVEIKKHPDIFKLEDQHISSDSSKTERAVDERLNAVTHAETSLQNDMKKNKEGLMDLTLVVQDLKKKMDSDFHELKIFVSDNIVQLMAQLRQSLATAETLNEEEYAEIELKESVIQSIKKICEERKIDESDFLGNLIKKEETIFVEMAEKMKPYNSLLNLIKEHRGSISLKLFQDGETGQLSYEEIKEISHGRFSRIKQILIGIGIGFAIGAVVIISLVASKTFSF